MKFLNKSNDILLIQCPPWDIGMPPLGIAYLSSYLRKYGYRTSVFDLNIVLYEAVKHDLKYLWEQKSHEWWISDDLFQKTWLQLKDITNACLRDVLKRENTKCIGLSVNSTGKYFAMEVIKFIKSIDSKTKIIVGGWGCITEQMRSLFPRELIDVFVLGEGEETLREVLEVFIHQRESRNILGAIFQKDFESEYKPRPPIKNLDEIPWPTFSEFDLHKYKHPVLPLLTSRGCIGRCSFCNDWVMMRTYRFRSAQNILKEIQYHIEYNHVTAFGFKDLLCNGDISRLQALSALIINGGIKINWDSQAIPRKEMTYELLCQLKNSGCRALIYGIESFSNNVLKKMRKMFTKEIAERVLEDTHKAGIEIDINIIVGFPGETEQDFAETMMAIERNRRYITQIGAVSICLVNNDCDLELNSQKYGLVLPEDPKIRPTQWHTKDYTNTYEIRTERAKKILELVHELKLTYQMSTL